MADAMDAQGLYNRGIEAFRSGDLDAAIADFETATQLDHSHHKAFNYLGAAYAAKGRYNAAIGAFKTAEQIAPDVASTHYNIGQAYEASGIPNEAEWEYERAVQIDPTYAKAQQALDRLKNRLHHI